jgi:hypothetical protein
MERRDWYLVAIICSAAFILLAILPWRGLDPTAIPRLVQYALSLGDDFVR